MKSAKIHKDSRGKFRFTVKAGNGRSIDVSEQGFQSIHSVVKRLKAHHADLTEAKVEYVKYAGSKREEKVAYTLPL
jgi:uncharacterized protein YegP (UPF0339 family)